MGLRTPLIVLAALGCAVDEGAFAPFPNDPDLSPRIRAEPIPTLLVPGLPTIFIGTSFGVMGITYRLVRMMRLHG